MASALGRSLEVPVAIGVLSQVGHPHDDEVSNSSEEAESDLQRLHSRVAVPEDGELPLLVTPTHSVHGESGVHNDGVIIEDSKLSITRVEEFPTLERADSDHNSASQLQRQQSQSEARFKSQQQPEHSQPPRPPLDGSSESTAAIYCQSLSRCGLVLLPWGPTYRREQVLLAVSLLSVSLALGACALYFRHDVDATTNMNSGLVFGSVGSLAMCSVIIGAYVTIKWYRRHMHTLLVNLALCEFFLALSFVLEPAWRHLGAGAGEGLSCRWVSRFHHLAWHCSFPF